MNTIKLVRFHHPEHNARIGLQIEDKVHDISEHFVSITEWLKSSEGRVTEAIDELKALASTSQQVYESSSLNNAPSNDNFHWLAPIDEQDVWASGVTYERSREARQEESIDGGDVYARVYNAVRPELFYKAKGENVVGHLGNVGIREDATWSVPEPELGLVMNAALEIVGLTAGNDMSSRDIEGENPLYLPQAKVYTASCAIGTGILLKPIEKWIKTNIKISITRSNKIIVVDSVSTERIKRTIKELVDYLGQSNTHPYGVVLLTGTGIVPPNEFTLEAGDEVEIIIDGVTTLKNTVIIV